MSSATFPARASGRDPKSCIDWFHAIDRGDAIIIKTAKGEPSMNPDRSTVEAVVQHYFDALYDGDADKLAAIFHPTADLRWLEQGELKVLTVPNWVEWVKKRPSAKAEGKPREDFIVTIDHSD